MKSFVHELIRMNTNKNEEGIIYVRLTLKPCKAGNPMDLFHRAGRLSV